MIKKTYTSISLSEVVGTIKKELGPQAVILSTRRIVLKKSLFRSPIMGVEVIAGVEENNLDREQLEKLKGSENTGSQKVEKKSAKKKSGLFSPFRADDVAVTISSDAERRYLESQLVKLEKENAELKMHAGGLSHQANISEKKSQEREPILQRLKNVGVKDELISEWISHSETLPQNSRIDEYADDALNFFLEIVPITSKPLPKVIALVGPSGSGKTVTALKLALMIRAQGKSVAIMSLDVVPAQMAYLKSYCDEYQISHSVLHQVRLTQDNYDERAQYDHVIIDTPALLTKSKTRLRTFEKKLEKMSAATFLVLSAKDGDNDEFVLACQSLQAQATIFTKLDECFKIGPVLNTLRRFQIPVAYFGIGRKCDDDFEVASAERLAALLFGIDDNLEEKPVEEKTTGEFKPISFLQGTRNS